MARRTAKKRARQAKIRKVMEEFKSGKLHSGSPAGPIVDDPKQAIAIALNPASKARKKRG